MTNNKLIGMAREFLENNYGTAHVIPYDAAVEFMSAYAQHILASQWMPVEDGLPTDDESFLISWIDLYGIHRVTPGYYTDGSWTNITGEYFRYPESIIAWMPWPQPYIKENK